jgi:hypothetical protein
MANAAAATARSFLAPVRPERPIKGRLWKIQVKLYKNGKIAENCLKLPKKIICGPLIHKNTPWHD